jgi:predicted RecA/RadA family phage recombinase
MAQNYAQPGGVIHAAATQPTTPVSGSPVLVGTIPGVALTNEGEGGNTAGQSSIATEGVFNLSVIGKGDDLGATAVAKGDKIYYADDELTPITKQIDTVTLTGTSGTANVTGAGGLTKLATFGDDLTDTAADFVTSHAAAYDAVGIVVTAEDATLIFTAKTAGTGFVHPAIANATGDLAGTVENTRANGVLFGKALGVIAEGEEDPTTATIPVMLIQV